jgi:hypothetical protein
VGGDDELYSPRLVELLPIRDFLGPGIIGAFGGGPDSPGSLAVVMSLVDFRFAVDGTGGEEGVSVATGAASAGMATSVVVGTWSVAQVEARQMENGWVRVERG